MKEAANCGALHKRNNQSHGDQGIQAGNGNAEI
jgi:hypothetical protein